MENNEREQNGAMHCRRCKVALKNGVCPLCGFRAYQPMDENKIRKIRMITGAVCLIAFAILFVILNLK